MYGRVRWLSFAHLLGTKPAGTKHPCARLSYVARYSLVQVLAFRRDIGNRRSNDCGNRSNHGGLLRQSLKNSRVAEVFDLFGHWVWLTRPLRDRDAHSDAGQFGGEQLGVLGAGL